VPRGQLRERNQFPPASLPSGPEENISSNNYGSAPYGFFGKDSSGKTSTIPDQNRSAGHWGLGDYQHKRANKMKHRYKQLGKLSLANMLRARQERPWHCEQSKKEAADESEKFTF